MSKAFQEALKDIQLRCYTDQDDHLPESSACAACRKEIIEAAIRARPEREHSDYPSSTVDGFNSALDEWTKNLRSEK